MCVFVDYLRAVRMADILAAAPVDALSAQTRRDKDKKAKFDRGEIDGAGNPTGFAGGGFPGGGPGGASYRWESRGGGNPFGGAQGDPFEDILSGMFGVGGGFLITPLLFFVGIPPAVAVATSDLA